MRCWVIRGDGRIGEDRRAQNRLLVKLLYSNKNILYVRLQDINPLCIFYLLCSLILFFLTLPKVGLARHMFLSCFAKMEPAFNFL